MGIHTQANFGKVAKGSNAYFSGLYRGIGSAARSARQVPLLCARILVASSQPLQIAQRDFGERFMCV